MIPLMVSLLEDYLIYFIFINFVKWLVSLLQDYLHLFHYHKFCEMVATAWFKRQQRMSFLVLLLLHSILSREVWDGQERVYQATLTSLLFLCTSSNLQLFFRIFSPNFSSRIFMLLFVLRYCS